MSKKRIMVLLALAISVMFLISGCGEPATPFVATVKEVTQSGVTLIDFVEFHPEYLTDTDVLEDAKRIAKNEEEELFRRIEAVFYISTIECTSYEAEHPIDKKRGLDRGFLAEYDMSPEYAMILAERVKQDPKEFWTAVKKSSFTFQSNGMGTRIVVAALVDTPELIPNFLIEDAGSLYETTFREAVNNYFIYHIDDLLQLQDQLNDNGFFDSKHFEITYPTLVKIFQNINDPNEYLKFMDFYDEYIIPYMNTQEQGVIDEAKRGSKDISKGLDILLENASYIEPEWMSEKIDKLPEGKILALKYYPAVEESRRETDETPRWYFWGDGQQILPDNVRPDTVDDADYLLVAEVAYKASGYYLRPGSVGSRALAYKTSIRLLLVDAQTGEYLGVLGSYTDFPAESATSKEIGERYDPTAEEIFEKIAAKS